MTIINVYVTNNRAEKTNSCKEWFFKNWLPQYGSWLVKTVGRSASCKLRQKLMLRSWLQWLTKGFFRMAEYCDYSEITWGKIFIILFT